MDEGREEWSCLLDMGVGGCVLSWYDGIKRSIIQSEVAPFIHEVRHGTQHVILYKPPCSNLCIRKILDLEEWLCSFGEHIFAAES
jgi:hypothetical protein